MREVKSVVKFFDETPLLLFSNQQTALGLVALGHIVGVLVSERFEDTAIENVAVYAVIMIWSDVFELQKTSLGRTMVHDDAEFAGLLVEFHGEIGGFLVEGMTPV
jgi:hypothetical protein